MLMVYKGKEIKIHIAGVVLKRGRPREINLDGMRAEDRRTIEDHKEIVGADVKEVAKAKSDVELVLDTPDYQPLRGHEIPKRKKAKRGK